MVLEKLKSLIMKPLNVNIGIGNKITNVIQDKTITELNNYLKKGDFRSVSTLFKEIVQIMSVRHPLYPNYVYSIVNEKGTLKLKSIPNNRQALEIYPPNIKGKFKLDKKYKEFRSVGDLKQYSYENQVPIKIDIISIKNFLGDIEDPIQEYEDLEIIDAYLEPAKFPEPQPCRIYFKGSMLSYDYIMLGLKRIKDQKLMILNNEQQEDSKLIFEIIYNFKDLNENKFNFKINEKYIDDVEANLEFLKFEKEIKYKRPMLVKLLKQNVILLEVLHYSVDYKTSHNIECEIKFLSKLMEIEQFFKVKFDLNKFNYLEEEYQALEFLYKAMRKEKKSYKCDDFKASFGYDSNVWNIIKDEKRVNKPVEVRCEENNATIDIMGVSIKIKKITYIFHNFVIKDIDKLINKIELMDQNDIYQVIFIPKNKKAKCEVSFDLE